MRGHFTYVSAAKFNLHIIVTATLMVFIHTGELPMTVNTQVFSAGSHSVKILATDSIGFTARAIINYSLPEVQTERELVM